METNRKSRMKNQRIYIIPGLAILFIVMAGFSNLPQEIKRTIDIQKADRVKTEITFPAGILYISANAKSFCEGIYKYRHDFWKPEIAYYEESGTGYLDIEFEDDRDRRSTNDSEENEWIIAFNRSTRNDIKIEMIAGESNIDLEGCKLDGFEFVMVAGESKINLRNTSVPFLEFKAVAGEAEIDLSGDWKNDLDAEIKGGVGDLKILVPSKVGVKVNITGGLGDVDAHGLHKDNRNYTNDLYGKTKNNLYIDVSGGIGNVEIRMAD